MWVSVHIWVAACLQPLERSCIPLRALAPRPCNCAKCQCFWLKTCGSLVCMACQIGQRSASDRHSLLHEIFTRCLGWQCTRQATGQLKTSLGGLQGSECFHLARGVCGPLPGRARCVACGVGGVPQHHQRLPCLPPLHPWHCCLEGQAGTAVHPQNPERISSPCQSCHAGASLLLSCSILYCHPFPNIHSPVPMFYGSILHRGQGLDRAVS